MNATLPAHASDVLHFRERAFPVRQVSAREGIELSRRCAEVDAATTARGQATAYAGVVALLGRLVRPPGLAGLLWPLRANPLCGATRAEVREMVGFFGRLQERSSVRSIVLP